MEHHKHQKYACCICTWFTISYYLIHVFVSIQSMYKSTTILMNTCVVILLLGKRKKNNNKNEKKEQKCRCCTYKCLDAVVVDSI